MWNKIKSLFKTYLITGLLVLLPLALTFWILNALLRSMEALIGDPIQQYLDIYIPGMGIILLLCLILLVGIFARNLIGKKLGQIGEKILKKIPLVSNIYSSFKQLVNTIFMQGKGNFRGVVLVEFPRKEIYSLGFITGTAVGEVQRLTQERVVNVFIPTTPNPTSGWFVLVPEKQITYLKMTVEEGLKMIISGGMVTPPDHEASLTQETKG